MSHKLLESCRQLADDVERHAGVLGLAWDDSSAVVRMCEDFRRSCKEVAENRGIDHVTLAFTGPKNSGKTQLLLLFVRGEDVRRRLRAGYTRAEATERVTWVGSGPPSDLREDSEMHVPCGEDDLVDLGFPYTLVDVPGLNESEERRADAAVAALDSALIKVFVVAQREMEDKALVHYLSRADGALILPVVNLVRTEPSRDDLEAFQSRIARALPNAEVLPAVCVRDAGVGTSEPVPGAGAVGPDDAAQLREAVRGAAGPRRLKTLPQSRLKQKQRQFRQEVARFMAERLPASRRALEGLRETEANLPQETLGHLLGSERALRAGVRQRLRATLLRRTPYVFFPWRAALAFANLLHGAVERIPFALMGSIPSWISGAFTAARNVKDAQAFTREVEGGVRDYVENAVKARILPKVRELEYVLNRELRSGREDAAAPRSGELSVRISGLNNLQTRSSEIFHSAVEAWAPSRAAATVCGLAGFLIFWGLFAWPVYSLYLDFFGAVRELIAEGAVRTGDFPSAPFGMLGTSLLLALLPMGFFMLAAVSLLVRPGKVTQCMARISDGHDEAVAELSRAGLLTIEVEQPRIDACLFLLKLAPDGSGD